MNEKISPAVSVIIPVFNAEKYLAVCLESIWIQTFQNFEVIVVDDCSTDSSPAIAESYLEKFGGRLKIIYLEENTGSGAVPRNVGLEHARGKYVYFVDSDDFLIDVTLEELFNYAENFQAEVVYMDCAFICDAEPIPKNINVAAWDKDNIVEKPTFETEDLAERVEKFLALQYRWPPWGKFLRRDFLINNKIKFPHMRISEDIIWTFELVCSVKNWLRISTPLYVQRANETSMTRLQRNSEQLLNFWVNPLLSGLEDLNKFMKQRDFFRQNPAISLQVMNLFASIHFQHMANTLKTLEPHEVYEIFLREFSKAGSSQPALISYLLVMNNLFRNELAK